MKLKETGSSNKPLVQDEAIADAPRRSIYGVPVYLSSQLAVTETQGTATNASSAYVYQADQVVAVMRQDVRVERDSSRLFNSDSSELRAIMRADVVVPNPKAVVRILGVIP
jgi:HK97 family phage major capsid protein